MLGTCGDDRQSGKKSSGSEPHLSGVGSGEYGTILYCDCSFGYRDSPLKYYTSSEIDTNSYDESGVHFECDKMQFIALKAHAI